MKTVVLVGLLLLCVGSVFAGEVAEALYFPPLEFAVGAPGEALDRITIVATDSPVARYAAEWLKSELERLFKLNSSIAPKGPEPLDGDVIFICHTASSAAIARLAPALAKKVGGPDSYALKLARRNDARIFVVCGADGPGALYGTQTLADVFRVMKGKAPDKLEAADRPEMKVRGKTAGVHECSPFQMKRFDWFARWRLNTAFYGMGEKKPADCAKMLAAECARRGIDLYGCISAHGTGQHFKTSLCPSNPEHLAYVDRLMEKAADDGVHGMMFLFDDIPPEDIVHAEKCPKCGKRFKDLAELQIFWLGRMVKIGRKYGVENYLMCPTPYLADLQSHVPRGYDSLGYFSKLGAYCARENIRVYHCAVRPKTIGPVLKAGVKDYAWWYNGVYTLRNVGARSANAVYYGIAKLKWGWEMTDWVPGSGLQMRTDALDTLRGLSRLTKEAWTCGSEHAQWGMYVWRPSRVEPDRLFRHVIEALFGPGSFKDYMSWEVPVHRCLTSLNVKVEPAVSAERKKDVAEQLVKDASQAREAVKRLRDYKGPSVGKPVRDGTRRAHALSRMQAQAKRLKKMADRFRAGGITVSKGYVRKSERRGITKFYRDMEVQNAWVAYRLRYCAYRQKDGSYRRGSHHAGCDLAMNAPSSQNWYGGGFIDVVLDGKSLERTRAEWSATKLADGRNGLQGTWKTPRGTVTMTLTLTEDNGLEITARLGRDVKAKKMVVPLLAYPATWDEPDKARTLTTAKRTVKAPFKVELDVHTENAAVLYDASYDVPHPKASGPCAFRFVAGAPKKVKVRSGNYSVNIALDYGDARSFRIILYDYAGCTNAEVLRHYRGNVFRK